MPSAGAFVDCPSFARLRGDEPPCALLAVPAPVAPQLACPQLAHLRRGFSRRWAPSFGPEHHAYCQQCQQAEGTRGGAGHYGGVGEAAGEADGARHGGLLELCSTASQKLAMAF